jgi:hypothetical protein
MPLYKREQKVAATCKETFRVKKKIAKELRRRKQRIQYRLRDINWKEQGKPISPMSFLRRLSLTRTGR